ncbi:transposase family protein [Nostocoides sp.]
MIRDLQNAGYSLAYPPSLGLRKSIIITMTYLRRNHTQADLADRYATSQPTISRTIAAMTPAPRPTPPPTGSRSRTTSTPSVPPDHRRNPAPVLVLGRQSPTCTPANTTPPVSTSKSPPPSPAGCCGSPIPFPGPPTT